MAHFETVATCSWHLCSASTSQFHVTTMRTGKAVETTALPPPAPMSFSQAIFQTFSRAHNSFIFPTCIEE